MDSHQEKVANGWILYYSEEGYPYYYNEKTGESEWAPVSENISYSAEQFENRTEIKVS